MLTFKEYCEIPVLHLFSWGIKNFLLLKHLRLVQDITCKMFMKACSHTFYISFTYLFPFTCKVCILIEKLCAPKTWLRISLLFYVSNLNICVFALQPVYTGKDAQEIEENAVANKRLQQQVLTLKAQLRDQAALQNQFHDLQNEVELLRAQLCEKV